jgi:hypothetical protein
MEEARLFAQHASALVPQAVLLRWRGSPDSKYALYVRAPIGFTKSCPTLSITIMSLRLQGALVSFSIGGGAKVMADRSRSIDKAEHW